MQFLELAKKVLEEENIPMTASEVWESAENKGYIKNLETKGKTPRNTLGARLYTAANDSKNLNFSSVGNSPKRFFLPGITPENALKKYALEPEAKEAGPTFKEKDLHALLAHFVRFQMEAFAKTISHPKSTKQKYRQWIHPDMVACFYPQEHWKSEVFDLSSKLGDSQVYLYSFELKQKLNFSNLRESFFQAVSNSSWAHEGYLVTAEIQVDPEFHKELGRLSDSFGIGVIHLDIEDPDNSYIWQQAERKDFVDWEMANKLTVNSDFKDFIKRIKDDITIKDIKEEWYDEVMETEDLMKKFSS